MELYDWLLFLHVLAAFVSIAAMTVLWGLVLGTREPEPAIDGPTATAIGRVAGIAVGASLGLVLLFGIWLVFEVDGYELWDGWILASIVLWVLGAATGGKSGRAPPRGPEGRQGWIRLQAVNSLFLVAILVLMIWKPGA